MFRNHCASDLNPPEIERRLNELAADGRKPATVNRYRTLLSLTFSLAVRNCKLVSNPVRLVKRPKENNERVRFLDDEEEVKLRTKIRESHARREAEFDLALHTGMRRGEQYGLRRQDVDLKRSIITIPRSKHGSPTYSDKFGGSCRFANPPETGRWPRLRVPSIQGTTISRC
jgi:integrase